ncbi:MAG TPA: nitroreductase [Candidatus Competibacteraceae bacterium]|nr:nitroreductase [Candidatus Competibacteraceae bacterium]
MSEQTAAIVAELLRGRRTVHNFKPAPVPPREAVMRALELARWAPNHRLTEPWRFYMIGPQTREAIVELNTETLIASKGREAAEAKARRWRSIPGWVVVTCQKSADPIQAQEDYAACACAIYGFMLALWSEGIGAKWSTGPVIREPRFYDLIWVDPEAEEVVGLVWYGYAEDIGQTTRKPLAECLVELP